MGTLERRPSCARPDPLGLQRRRKRTDRVRRRDAVRHRLGRTHVVELPFLAANGEPAAALAAFLARIRMAAYLGGNDRPADRTDRRYFPPLPCDQHVSEVL